MSAFVIGEVLAVAFGSELTKQAINLWVRKILDLMASFAYSSNTLPLPTHSEKQKQNHKQTQTNSATIVFVKEVDDFLNQGLIQMKLKVVAGLCSVLGTPQCRTSSSPTSLLVSSFSPPTIWQSPSSCASFTCPSALSSSSCPSSSPCLPSFSCSSSSPSSFSCSSSLSSSSSLPQEKQIPIPNPVPNPVPLVGVPNLDAPLASTLFSNSNSLSGLDQACQRREDIVEFPVAEMERVLAKIHTAIEELKLLNVQHQKNQKKWFPSFNKIDYLPTFEKITRLLNDLETCCFWVERTVTCLQRF